MPRAPLASYAAEDVMVVVGLDIVTGTAPDTFVKASYNVDRAEDVVGSDGSVCVVVSANNTGKISIMLQGSSPSNDDFMAKHAAFLLNKTFFPVYIKDNRGKKLVTAPAAYFSKTPDVELGDNLSNIEWVINVPDLNIVQGSNYGVSLSA